MAKLPPPSENEIFVYFRDKVTKKTTLVAFPHTTELKLTENEDFRQRFYKIRLEFNATHKQLLKAEAPVRYLIQQDLDEGMDAPLEFMINSLKARGYGVYSPEDNDRMVKDLDAVEALREALRG